MTYHNLKQFHMNWNYPTTIYFGMGRVKELSNVCLENNIKNPLIVSDPNIVKLNFFQRITEDLKEKKIPFNIFSDIQENPIETNVISGINEFKDGCHDGVITIGGGSATDVGKTIAFAAHQVRPLWDFEDRADWFKRAEEENIAPIIAIPTTSGTGSEVGRASVITDLSDQTKKVIFHPKMMPTVVIADPELTLSVPSKVTAAVGMDAFSHNLEAYCSPLYHPMADGIGLEAMSLVKNWLPEAVQNGDNLEARAHMMSAAMMGATAFQKGLGAMHSMSHPCSAILGSQHGLTNAIVMPYVLIFNREAIEDKIVHLSQYLGLKKPSFNAFVDWVLWLRDTIGIPHSLSDIGVEEAHIDQLSEMAEKDPTAGTNPIPVGKQEFVRLFHMAIESRLTLAA